MVLHGSRDQSTHAFVLLGFGLAHSTQTEVRTKYLGSGVSILCMKTSTATKRSGPCMMMGYSHAHALVMSHGC